MKKNKFSKSLHTAILGITHSISTERNIKIQILTAIFVGILSILLKISKIELIFILLVSFFVIISELINTSFERLIDKLSPNFDNEYGKIKDIMAGAVLLSAILALIIGFLVLSKPILYFFGGL